MGWRWPWCTGNLTGGSPCTAAASTSVPSSSSIHAATRHRWKTPRQEQQHPARAARHTGQGTRPWQGGTAAGATGVHTQHRTGWTHSHPALGGRMASRQTNNAAHVHPGTPIRPAQFCQNRTASAPSSPSGGEKSRDLAIGMMLADLSPTPNSGPPTCLSGDETAHIIDNKTRQSGSPPATCPTTMALPDRHPSTPPPSFGGLKVVMVGEPTATTGTKEGRWRPSQPRHPLSIRVSAS